jgi:L-fuculose-phosphate aldolase
MSQGEYRLRQEIVEVGRRMYDKGLISASEGNISARLDEERLLITPSGLHKGFLNTDDLLLIDRAGTLLGPRSGSSKKLRPTSELPLHLESYRLRPDIGAVVHAHPPTTIALSIAGIPLADCLLPEVIVFLGLIPTTEYATPSSEETVNAVRQLLINHDAIVLQRHGSLTVGDTPMDGFIRLEIVEQNAHIAFMLNQLGANNPLPPDEVRKLLKMRADMGLARPGESQEFCNVCGVCHTGKNHLPILRAKRRGKQGSMNGMAAGPQSLPPIKQPSIDEVEVRTLVSRMIRKTLGSD